MWERLPRIYRILDAQQAWAFKAYLAGVTSFAGELDVMVERLRGGRPVGPELPEPWDLDPDDLARWRDAHDTRTSELTDPVLADEAWLPWLAQLVGAYLDPAASIAERRDTIRFATSGYRGGTRAALADAARSALTGSRYVLVQPATRGDGTAGTLWDITLRTRTSETPSPAEVLATVLRKGAKPAGAVLWHASFGTSWDRIESLFPTWTDWEARSWDVIEEAGITFADVPENLAPNASFEAGVTSWTSIAEGGGTVSTWAGDPTGGVDGAASGQLTKVGATGGMRVRSSVIIDARILPAREYLFSVSGMPSAAVLVSLVVDWQTSAGAVISSTTVATGTSAAGAWNRSTLTSRHTSPALAARAVLNVVATGTIAAGVTLDLDAVLFRLVTTLGG
jgi:hypothetical protein